MTTSHLTSRPTSVVNSLASDHESFHSCSSNAFGQTQTASSPTAASSDSPFIRTLSYELDSNVQKEITSGSTSTSATVSFNSGSSGYSAASALSASSLDPDSAKYRLSPSDTYALSLTRPSCLNTHSTTPIRTSPTDPYSLAIARISPTNASPKAGTSPTNPPHSRSSRTSPSHHYYTSRPSPSHHYPPSGQRSPEQSSVSPYTKRPAPSASQANGSHHTCRRSTSGVSISKIAQRSGSQKSSGYPKKASATRFPMYVGGVRVNSDGYPMPLEPVPGSDYENLAPGAQGPQSTPSQPPPPAPSAGTGINPTLLFSQSHPQDADEASNAPVQQSTARPNGPQLQLQRTSRSHTMNEICSAQRDTLSQPSLDRSVTTSAINAAAAGVAGASGLELSVSPQSAHTLQDSAPSTPAFSTHDLAAHTPTKRKPSFLQRILKFPLFRSRSSLHQRDAGSRRSPPSQTQTAGASSATPHLLIQNAGHNPNLNPIATRTPVQPAPAQRGGGGGPSPFRHSNLELQPAPNALNRQQPVVTIEVDAEQPAARPPVDEHALQMAPVEHQHRVTSKPPSGRDRRRRSLGVALHAAFGLRRPSPKRHGDEPQGQCNSMILNPGAETAAENSSTVKRKKSLFTHAHNQNTQAERTAQSQSLSQSTSSQKTRGSNSTAYRDSGICRDSLCAEEPSDATLVEPRAGDQSGGADRVDEQQPEHPTRNGQWDGRRRSTTNPELASREFEPELAPIGLEGAPPKHTSLYDRRASTLGLNSVGGGGDGGRRPTCGSRSTSRQRADSNSRAAGGFFARKILWRLRSKKSSDNRDNKKKELAASTLALSNAHTTSSERPLCFGPASAARTGGSQHRPPAHNDDEDEEREASPPRSTESGRLRSKRMSLPACVQPDAQFQRLQRLHQLNAGLGLPAAGAPGGPSGDGGGCGGSVTSSSSIYQKARSASRAVLTRDRIGSVSASVAGLSRKERRASLVRTTCFYCSVYKYLSVL